MNTAEIEDENETSKYFLVVYDDVPGILTPSVAYRRAGQQKYRDVKVINCPYCNNSLTEVGRNTKVELYRYPARKQIRCHSYPVCRICKNEVGMILA